MSLYPTSSVMMSTTFGRSADCACTLPVCPMTIATTSQRALLAPDIPTRIVDASLWPVRTLLENRAQRNELRGVDLTGLHRRNRHVTIVDCSNICSLGGRPAFLVDIPIDRAAGRGMRRLRKVLLAAALHRLGGNAVSAIPALRHRRNVHVQEGIRG